MFPHILSVIFDLRIVLEFSLFIPQMLRGVASSVGFVTGISTAIVAFDDNLSTTTTLTTFLKVRFGREPAINHGI
jgi:hypothetical protein